MPIPRRSEVAGSGRRAGSAKRVAFSSRHRSNTARTLTPGGSGWPVVSASPSLYRFFWRTSAGSSPSAWARRVTIDSAAKCACGVPKPRKAPLGTLLVYTTIPSVATFGIEYGPQAKIDAHLSTSTDVDAYAPPSATDSISAATIVPSRLAPHLVVIVNGWRL